MSSRSWFRGSLVAGVLIVSGMLATPASSQQTQQQSQQPETTASQQPSVAEEIVVTARKREEDVQEVPIAVSVVTADELEEAAAADISELQTQVPNLAIYQGRNQSTTLTVFLRGIGQADPLWGVDPGVGLYLDDVYIARPQGALLDVYDVERIEVLRGPQGTLYGKNTIGGAIKYVSRALTDSLNAAVSVSPGSYGQLDLRASLGGAVIPGKLRGRVAVASLTRDGYGENLFTNRDVSDRNTLAARGALDWLISTRTKVQFGVDYTQDEAQPKGYERLAPNPFCNTFLGAPCPSLGDRFNTQSGLAPLNGTDSFGSSIVVSSDLNDAWRFKSITAYRESDSENNIDFDTTPAPITDVSATYYDEQLTQEFQFVYDPGSRLAAVLGLYYFDGEAGGLVKNNFLNLLFGTTDGKTFTESIAIFGDGSFAVTPRARLNVGLRATQEEKNGVAFNAGYRDGTFQEITAVVADYDKTATFDSIAPRLGIDYQFSDSVLGYFSVNRGFKSGGFNVRAQATVFPQSADPFDDEVLTVGELGLKSVLLDDRLVVNSAVFHGKYEDIQVSTFTAYDSNNDGTDDAFFGNFLNAGSATMNGAEVELDYTPAAVNWLNVNGFVSWLDLEPDDFLDANRDGFVDTQVITNAPEWTGGLRFNFDFPVAGGLFTASTGAAYRSDSTLTNEGGQYPGLPGVPLLPIRQDAYAIFDAWVSWLSGDGHWRFGVAAKNLGDEAYLTNGYNIPALGIMTGSYGAPATAQATIEYRFFR